MRRGREFVGLTVYREDAKEPVGTVSDLVFRVDGTLEALIVAPVKGFFRKERPIPIDSFSRIDKEGAVLEAGYRPDQPKPQSDRGWRLLKDEGLCGRTLLTERGDELGVIGDVVLDHLPYRIWGFEVSDGLLKDLLEGRPIVDARGAECLGEAVVLSGGPEEPFGRSHMNLSREGHDNTREGSD